MNATMIEKFRKKFTTGDFGPTGGLLDPAQAERFIKLWADQTILLKAATQRIRDDRSGDISFIDPNQFALRKANAELAAHNTATWLPATATRHFEVQKMYAHFLLSWEDLKWTIEGPQFEETVMELFANAMSDSGEALAILGDESATPTATPPYLEELQEINDGWLTLLENDPGVHVVDMEGATIDWTVFARARNAMPFQYQANRNLRWICSPRLIADYRHYLTARQDGLGASALEGRGINPEGIPFLNDPGGVPYLPFNLDGESPIDNDSTVMLLCDPKQLGYVVHRQFQLYRQFLPAQDGWGFWGYAYTDYLILNPQAIVMVKGIRASTDYGAVPDPVYSQVTMDKHHEGSDLPRELRPSSD